MSSSLHSKRRQSTHDTGQARTVALQQFSKGDRVRHRTTGKVGSFIESHSGFALPEVWVQFDSETDIQVPISCNPLDLELVARDCDTASNAITPQVVDELTELEERLRHRLELWVEKAFYEAGVALRELKNRKLYRSTHKTWEAYCHERFGFGRDSADIKILASLAVEEIRENLPTNHRQILPTTLEQVRPLLKLKDSSERIEAWVKAIDTNHGKVPSGRIVKGIVMQLKEKPLHYATDFCSVGDVFTLIQLEGNVRKYNRCPCVVVELNEFTIMVDVYDTTIMVKPENLNRIDSPDVGHQLPATLSRIKRLQQCDLDRGAINVLEDLGRQTYLTDLEEKLLSFLEREYEIDC